MSVLLAFRLPSGCSNSTWVYQINFEMQNWHALRMRQNEVYRKVLVKTNGDEPSSSPLFTAGISPIALLTWHGMTCVGHEKKVSWADMSVYLFVEKCHSVKWRYVIITVDQTIACHLPDNTRIRLSRTFFVFKSWTWRRILLLYLRKWFIRLKSVKCRRDVEREWDLK